ncbi:MAG: FliI/YscN family ATPase, partial [Planctomycetota bacterium]
VRTGPGLLGRVIDGFGRPIDDLGPLPAGDARPLDPPRTNPLARVPIRKPLATGVRAIDTLLTCGRGQRVGLFAGPGVGKSTLLAHVAKHTDADVSVIALIGERGREVADFLHDTLGPEGLKRSVVIVSTGDDTPLLKVRAAKLACAVAEGFRDAGKDVLLLMDSLTRLAHAQRQIGLAAGEPPATRGYPPSVFALLPSILERAGTTTVGTITGFYTVLIEGDDFDEPVADAVKGIADGHFLLTRKLAEKGHYPALDVLRSVSRVRTSVTDPIHRGRADRILQLESTYRELTDLLSVGAFVSGQNPEHDLAVAASETIQQFLQQPDGDHDDFASARRKLDMIHAQIENAAQQIQKRPQAQQQV